MATDVGWSGLELYCSAHIGVGDLRLLDYTILALLIHFAYGVSGLDSLGYRKAYTNSA